MYTKNLLLFFFSILFFCSSIHGVERELKVIVDTDCDMDDMMAILYLLKRNDVEVLAITTTGTGMAHWSYSAPNILNLLELAGHPKIPVSFGAKTSLSPYSNFPEAWRKDIDEVYNISLPKNPNPPSKLSSWELLVQTAEQSEEKITLLCLAPMTNVALALENHPSVREKIERIVISGGALGTKGNVVGEAHGYKNTCAEYNIFLDAKAAEDVLSSGIPITLVPLNATEDAPIDEAIFEKFKAEKRNPSANFVFEVIKPYVESQKGTPVYFWDPVAAAVMTNPSLGSYEWVDLVVNQHLGPRYGCLFQEPSGSPVKAYLSIDAPEFYRLFYDTLSQE